MLSSNWWEELSYFAIGTSGLSPVLATTEADIVGVRCEEAACLVPTHQALWCLGWFVPFPEEVNICKDCCKRGKEETISGIVVTPTTIEAVESYFLLHLEKQTIFLHSLPICKAEWRGFVGGNNPPAGPWSNFFLCNSGSATSPPNSKDCNI